MIVKYGKGFGVKSAALTPEQVANFRAELSALPQFEPQTDNYFVPVDGGFLYCRKVSRPAGVATLGRVHRQEHFYVIAKGSVALRGENSATVHQAGEVIVSKPGTQRLVVSLEDSVTITMHKVSSMDIEQIERELVEDDDASNYSPGNKLKQLTHEGVERIGS